MSTLLADEPVLRLAIGVIAGFFAALVMDIPMRRQSEGMVPPVIAASVVLSEPPGEVADHLAKSVHYLAGVLGGVLFAILTLVLDLVVGAGRAGDVTPTPRTALGLEAGVMVLAGVLVLGFLYAFFGYVVLPRYGREKRAVADTVRAQWLRSAVVYVLALVVLVPLGTTVFG